MLSGQNKTYNTPALYANKHSRMTQSSKIMLSASSLKTDFFGAINRYKLEYKLLFRLSVDNVSFAFGEKIDGLDIHHV